MDERGQVIVASKILRDISERKRLEKSLLQAEKLAATGRMAATIAHEINNPLEAVVNLLYLLRPSIIDPEGIKRIDSVESELARISHIARQTLGYYRENASAIHMSLSELVQHAITIYEPRCEALGIEIRKSLDSSRTIRLRRGEMMQVISNLISNSIYAMQRGGTLTVSVKDAESASALGKSAPDEIVLLSRITASGLRATTCRKYLTPSSRPAIQSAQELVCSLRSSSSRGTVVALRLRARTTLRITAPSFASYFLQVRRRI